MFDLVIIGAGAVGLACAAHFSHQCPRWDILVIEQEDGPGRGISSRNSEVIHAGIYYPENWLKSVLAVEGRRRLYPFLEKYGIPHRRLGKVIVAHQPDQVEPLERLYGQAREKGVEGLKLISRTEISRCCPGIEAQAGIFSAETGILSTGRLIQVLQGLAQNRGCHFLWQSTVQSAQRSDSGFRIKVMNPSTGCDAVDTRRVINAAGLEAESVARLAGLNIPEHTHYWQGHYYTVDCKRYPVKHLVYPLPDEVHLGIHLTLDLNGTVRLGPDAVFLDGARIDYRRFLTSEQVFRNSVLQFWPAAGSLNFTPDFVGVRPKLSGPGEPPCDFIIRHESQLGYPNWINLLGIESPGLTASLAIGPWICEAYPEFWED